MCPEVRRLSLCAVGFKFRCQTQAYRLPKLQALTKLQANEKKQTKNFRNAFYAMHELTLHTWKYELIKKRRDKIHCQNMILCLHF